MNEICGVILAAGKSSRMGAADKAEKLLEGIALIDHVIRRMKPQVDRLVINTIPDRHQKRGLPIIYDMGQSYMGPLHGIHSALTSYHMKKLKFLAVAPCDAPLLPSNLFEKLYVKLIATDSDVSCIRYNKITQPTFSLWRKEKAAQTIYRSICKTEHASIKGVFNNLKVSYLDWPKCLQNPFYNVNTPADLKNLRMIQCH
jgi:molybdopterin-guanine dinucleotide biosynthesis protein A